MQLGLAYLRIACHPAGLHLLETVGLTTHDKQTLFGYWRLLYVNHELWKCPHTFTTGDSTIEHL